MPKNVKSKFPAGDRKLPPSTIPEYNKAGKTVMPNPYGPQKEPAKGIKQYNKGGKKASKFPK